MKTRILHCRDCDRVGPDRDCGYGGKIGGKGGKPGPTWASLQ